jgi:LPXTG-motif cell wall-anchored protein
MLPATGSQASAVVVIGLALLAAGIVIWIAGRVLGSDVE